MKVTTTHDPEGGGRPRLLFTVGQHHGAMTAPQDAFLLRKGVSTLGSDPANDLCLAGLADFHAEVRRTDSDDYVLVSLSGAGDTRVHGRPVTSTELHTGARIEMGPWVLSFARAESADHGRPNGGRQGGELSAGPRVGP